MARKSKPNYDPEFRRLTADVAIASPHPNILIAESINVNPSTFGSWVAARKKELAQKLAEKGKKEDGQQVKDVTRAPAKKKENTKRKMQEQLNLGTVEAEPAFFAAHALNINYGNTGYEAELQRLREVNQQLVKERDMFRKVILMFAGGGD